MLGAHGQFLNQLRYAVTIVYGQTVERIPRIQAEAHLQARHVAAWSKVAREISAADALHWL